MSDLVPNENLTSESEESDQEIEVIEIDIINLTKEQKISFTIVMLTFIAEIILLAGIRNVTDVFKLFIRDQDKKITGFVADFIATLTPYIFVLVTFFLLYELYCLIIEDSEQIQLFAESFNILFYGLLGNFMLIIIFVMINHPEISPQYSQLSIFVFYILLLVWICFFPSYYYKSRIFSNSNENTEVEH